MAIQKKILFKEKAEIQKKAKRKKAPPRNKAKTEKQKSKTLAADNPPKVERELSLEQRIDVDYLKGIAGALFPKATAQIKNGKKLSSEQLEQLSIKMLKSEVGRNFFAFIAEQQKAHEKLGMTLEEYARKYANCSRDEFKKRVRRAEHEIELFGTPDYIGTLNNAVLDALNSIRFNESKAAMVDTFNGLMAKKETDKNFEITVPEVNSLKLELFPITEHSKCEAQQSAKNGNAVQVTSEPTDSTKAAKEQDVKKPSDQKRV